MTKEEMQVAIKRILAGERATLVVRPEYEAEVRARLTVLSPRLRALLTISVRSPEAR